MRSSIATHAPRSFGTHSSKSILLVIALCLAIFSFGTSETGDAGLSSEGIGAENGEASPPLNNNPRLLATVTLQVSSSSGGESTHDTLTLRAGQSPLAAAFDFVQKHNVNVQEIVSLSKSLEQDLERRHGRDLPAGGGALLVPEERFAELGVEAFPKLRGEEEHALRAAELMDQGLFKEAAIHFALAAELVPEPAVSVVDGSAADGLDDESAQVAAIEAAATRRRVREYHSSATSIVTLLRTLAEQETEIAELMAAEKWIPAMNALEELKSAGGPYLCTFRFALVVWKQWQYSALSGSCRRSNPAGKPSIHRKSFGVSLYVSDRPTGRTKRFLFAPRCSCSPGARKFHPRLA